MKKKLILASASPRRKELLERIGLDFTIVPARGEERISCTEPNKVVEELSYQKASEVCQRAEEGTVVLGSDTVVALDNRILGKPGSEEEAYEMLSSLQGREHDVYTGVTLMEKGGRCVTFSCRTSVKVFPMSEQEIWDYIKTKDPMDKAGAYGIQGIFCAYVEEIRGDYNTVVGLPVSRVYQELKTFGMEIK